MSTDPLNEPEREVLHEKPRQFRLIHLLGVMTALGILSAIFAPAIWALKSEHANAALIVVGSQLAVMTAAFFYGSSRRRTALRDSGARLGQSYTGSPGVQKVISITVIGAMQYVCLSIVLASIQQTRESTESLIAQLFVHNFFVLLFSVPFLLHVFWRRHLGVVEFFEHGIAMTPMKFTPWELVDVQQHETKENGIQLTVTTKGKLTRNLIVPALVSPELRRYLLKHHSRPDEPAEEKSFKRVMLFDP